MAVAIEITTSMSIRANGVDLTKALKAVKPFIAARCPLPICSMVMMQATSRGLILQGTNLDDSISLNVNAECIEYGEVCVPLAPLLDAVMGSESVGLTVDGVTVHVTTGRRTVTIQGMPGCDFPVLPLPHENVGGVPAWELSRVLGSTWQAAATDDARPMLTGVNLAGHGEYIETAATDGFRLMMDRTFCKSEPFSCIVPAAFCKRVSAIMAKRREYVGLSVLADHVVFSGSGIRLTSRLLHGNFPNYRQLIPTRFVSDLTVPADELAAIASQADKDNSNLMTFDVGENTVTLHAPHADETDITASLAVPVSGGGPIAMQFNARYLLDIARAHKGQGIRCQFSGHNSPAVFTPSAFAAVYVVMPVHMSGRR